MRVSLYEDQFYNHQHSRMCIRSDKEMFNDRRKRLDNNLISLQYKSAHDFAMIFTFLKVVYILQY